VVASRVAIDLEDEAKRKRMKKQHQSLMSPRDEKVPDAIVGFVELVEVALQLSAVEGRARLANRGELVSDPSAWEDKLCELILNDPLVPIALEYRREPRPANALLPGAQAGTVRLDDGSAMPTVVAGPFAGWRVLASVEWCTQPSTWNQPVGPTKTVSCAAEFRSRGDGTALDRAPLFGGDGSIWRESDAVPEKLPTPPISLAGIAIDAASLSDAAYGLGLWAPLLLPAPWLVGALGLRPGDELELIDDAGPALALRTWRSRYEGGEYNMARPLLRGAQLVLRGDLVPRLTEVTSGALSWREFVTSDEDDEVNDDQEDDEEEESR
jgi:hypothetical protein